MSLCDKTKKWLSAHGDVSLRGKTVLVTGANSGVGFKTAETALYLGADVILACRSAEKAQAARETLLRDHPNGHVEVMRLDLASLASIDAFVTELRESRTDIHVFVNNAGAFHHPGQQTADGFDLVLGTNYLGTYYLTEQVLPYLQTLPHEVWLVNTVSVIIKVARAVDYDDFYFARAKKPRNLGLYARSKRCLATYSIALAERMKGSNIRVVMSHPGISLTPLGLNAFGRWVNRLAVVFRPLFNSPEKSSLALACLLSQDLPAGSLAGPHILFDCFGYPRKNKLPRRVLTGAEALIRFTDEELAKRK